MDVRKPVLKLYPIPISDEIMCPSTLDTLCHLTNLGIYESKSKRKRVQVNHISSEPDINRISS